MNIKTVVLCLCAMVIFAAGCSKKNTNTSSRDAFVGNYAMHDTIIHENGYGSNITFDTSRLAYTLVVVPVAGTSDRVAFNNANDNAGSDTGIVSGNVVSFVGDQPTLATATLSGNKITFAGGYIYTTSTFSSGYTTIYATGVGIKQ